MKILLSFLLFLAGLSALAETGLELKGVDVHCEGSELCETRKTRFSNLIGEYRSLVHLKETLRIMASDGGYQYFTYSVFKENDVLKLTIDVAMKPTIETINVGLLDRNLETDPLQLLSLKEGEFFEEQKLKESLDGLQKKLESMGFPSNSNRVEVVEKGGKVYLDVAITLGAPRLFKGIRSNAESPYVKDFLEKKFYRFYNKPFEYTKFKLYLDDVQKELFSYGYYLLGLDMYPEIKKNRVKLDIKISNEKLFAFDFKNLKQENREVLHALVKDLFKKYKRPLPEANLRLAILEHYRNRALLNTEVAIETSSFKNKYHETVHLYRIRVDEKYKTHVTNVAFSGNTFFSRKELTKMFEKEAFELASVHYYDEEYFNYFVGFLKSQYISKGFVQAKVLGPNKSFDVGKKQASVEYVIEEGQRAFIKSISFEGLDHDLEENLAADIANKTGNPFNPIALSEDVKKIATTLQEKGYYFAEVTNGNEDSLVRYSRTGSEVDINFKINLGPLVRLNRVIFLGNTKTKKEVLIKKIALEKNDLVTPVKTRDIEAALSATGLFNSVSAVPVRHNSQSALTDLIVKVTERDYVSIEVAPGYRTDIGLKLTGTVSHMNLGGLNRSVTLRSQINQRLNYQTFDPRRRHERRQLLEHNTTLTYNQGDIWGTKIDSATGLAFQRKRFYSFDADIQRFNNTFTRDITKQFSTSLRYQLEKITQSDATQLRDNGSFQIGAFTPSITYDLRNSQVLPVKGSFYNLSCEFANPYFLSQKNSDLTVDFYKLVSRNRFYIPFKGGTVAISMVGGVQENLAKSTVKDANGQPIVTNGVKQTEGYIPNIKVFRLTGMDIVRGFTDQEINRLTNGKDISEVRVQNHAFIANLKLEPRYFINDTLMTGVFLDAGRVYVDQVDLGELRTSTGVTFKILTPVGTLDFDYGIKLLRKRNADGTLEDPGRFHVSIGFF